MSAEVSIFIPPAKKRVSESRRQQNVYRYFVPHLTGIDLTNELDAPHARLPPENHVPKPSSDAGLTAFAQLGAIRLGASRGFISLIDGHRQYILAEATPSLSLRRGTKEAGKDRLWLGNDGQRVSRTAGEDYDNAVIIDDLNEHEEYASEWFIHDGPHIRFYAGVPLLCPDGSAIGAFCIFDDVPRKGLSRDDLVIMQDLAATVMQHLTTYKFERDLRRGERMVRGLTSFIEGAKSLQPAYSPGDSPAQSPPLSPMSPMKSIDDSSRNVESDTNAQGTLKAILAPPREMSGATSTKPSSERNSEKVSSLPDQPPEPPLRDTPGVQTVDHARFSPPEAPRNMSPNPRDSLLPMGAKLMFSRAANIIRETSDLDGVIMFDASVAANKTRTSASRKAPPVLERESSGQTDDSESSGMGSPYPRSGFYSQLGNSQSSHDRLSDTNKRRRKMCHMLCFSDGDKSSVSGESAGAMSSYRNLAESDLKKMLDRYPEGKVINFDASGNFSSADDDYIRPGKATSEIKRSKVASKNRKRSVAEAIQEVAPGARTVAILPLFDYERQRWFAVGLFFSRDQRRILSPELDLVYFKAFGNTMMTELSRLDAINSNNTKTTFVASISHELRSPLHGILGGVEFMQGSDMNAFQASMLNSIEMCGKTLLDTIDHILDFSKINELTNTTGRPPTRVRMKSSKRVLVSPLRSRRHENMSTSLSSTIDLALSAEEVVEAVFAGKSYRVMSNRVDEQPKMAWPGRRKKETGKTSPKQHRDTDRKNILILLDIPHRENWRFQTQPGAWRRILMNIFGNALKYTESGFIRVSLAAHDNGNSSWQAGNETEDSSGSLSSIEAKYTADTRVTLTVSDSGIGMSEDYLANRIYTPFSQENSFFAGTGLGLSIVRQLVESLGGSIDVRSQRRLGTEVRVDINLPSSGVTPISEDFDLNPVTALATRIQGKKICVLEKLPIPKPATESQSSTRPAAITHTLGSSLVATLKDWFHLDVTLSNQWQDPNFEIVILTEVSFDYLEAIRESRTADNKALIVILIALDAIEASSLRNDMRIINDKSTVEIITQPCGPQKLAKALNYCLDRYESVFENQPLIENLPFMPIPSVSPKDTPTPVPEQVEETKSYPYILIVDDNDINRRLLVAFMNKNGFAYKEAIHGQEAVEMVKSTPQPFDVVIMDLSMPVMDGVTATREIRRYEDKQHIKRCKIIALTGQASTSARIEALASGADQFLTKPIRFQVLKPLLNLRPAENDAAARD